MEERRGLFEGIRNKQLDQLLEIWKVLKTKWLRGKPSIGSWLRSFVRHREGKTWISGLTPYGKYYSLFVIKSPSESPQNPLRTPFRASSGSSKTLPSDHLRCHFITPSLREPNPKTPFNLPGPSPPDHRHNPAPIQITHTNYSQSNYTLKTNSTSGIELLQTNAHQLQERPKQQNTEEIKAFSKMKGETANEREIFIKSC